MPREFKAAGGEVMTIGRRASDAAIVGSRRLLGCIGAAAAQEDGVTNVVVEGSATPRRAAAPARR